MRFSYIVAAASLCLSFSNAGAARCDHFGKGAAGNDARKAALNILKNNTDEAASPSDVEVADILGYPDREDRNLERKPVMLKGQLLQRVKEKKESPNCNSPTRVDYHIFIGATDTAHPDGTTLSATRVKSLKKESVVVELTPNIQDNHHDWAGRLQSLVGKNVCITGWTLFDYEHQPQVGQTRGTLWEVHPITGIGVLNANRTCEQWQ